MSNLPNALKQLGIDPFTAAAITIVGLVVSYLAAKTVFRLEDGDPALLPTTFLGTLIIATLFLAF